MKRKNKPALISKFIKALPVFLGAAVFIYVGLIIKDIEVSTVLPISEVQVDGELTFLNKNDLKMIVENNIDGGFFTVDLNNVRQILLQQSWVKSVSLRRQWPAGVLVLVEERTAIAYWNDDGYISAEGVVFKPKVINKGLTLPVLNGPEGQHANVWKFMNVLYTEMALLNYEVDSLSLDARRAWRLEITNTASVENESQTKSIDVRLGRFDTEKRMKRFIRILPALTPEKESVGNMIKVIDMRYPNGFSVRMLTDEKTAVRNTNVKKMTAIRNLLTHNFSHVTHRAAMQMSEA